MSLKLCMMVQMYLDLKNLVLLITKDINKVVSL